MTTQQQLLRQADNTVKISGKVAQVDLAVKDFKDKKTQQPYKAINGKVTVKVNDEESHVVSYFVKEFTSKGTPNRSFQGLQTFMEKTVSIADIANGIVPEGSTPSIVAINSGNLSLNEYKGADGNVVSNLQINANFAPSEVKNLEGFKAKAEFDLEGIVGAVKEETKDGEPTGRAKILLYVPLYGGQVIPLELVTSEEMGEEGGQYAQDNFVKGSSVNLWGEFINKNKEITRVKEGGFGKSKTETTTIRLRELSVTGGELYEEGVHDKKIFDIKLLKEALANRERKLSTIKEQVVAPRQTQANKPAGFGASKPVTNSAPVTDSDLDDPFGED